MWRAFNYACVQKYVGTERERVYPNKYFLRTYFSNGPIISVDNKLIIYKYFMQYEKKLWQFHVFYQKTKNPALIMDSVGEWEMEHRNKNFSSSTCIYFIFYKFLSKSRVMEMSRGYVTPRD